MTLIERVPYLSLRDAIVALCDAVDNIDTSASSALVTDVETLKSTVAAFESRIADLEGKTVNLREDVGEDIKPVDVAV